MQEEIFLKIDRFEVIRRLTHHDVRRLEHWHASESIASRTRTHRSRVF